MHDVMVMRPVVVVKETLELDRERSTTPDRRVRTCTVRARSIAKAAVGNRRAPVVGPVHWCRDGSRFSSFTPTYATKISHIVKYVTSCYCILDLFLLPVAAGLGRMHRGIAGPMRAPSSSRKQTFSVKMVLLSAVLLLCSVVGAAAWMKGMVLGLDEWSPASTPFGSAASLEALQAFAATGADHVRIIITQYVDNVNSTTIYPITGESAIASADLNTLRAAVTAAHSLNLKVAICPVIDPSWDIYANGRSSFNPPPGSTSTSRLKIGQGYDEADWAAFFASYADYVLPVAQLAQETGVELFEVGSELDIAFTTREADWRAMIAKIKAVYSGPLTIAADGGTIYKIGFWDVLDYVGVDAYYSLEAATNNTSLDLGVEPSVSALVAAWQPIVAELAAFANQTGKAILLTEVGYQSRPSCHVRTWGTAIHDPMDDSAWLMDRDPGCQANAYEALLRAFAPQPWWAGVFWWLWLTDPSAGGTFDAEFSPHGKPAEVVLRRWYGNYTCSANGAYGADFLAPGSANGDGMTVPWIEIDAAAGDAAAGDAECDGSASVAAAVTSLGMNSTPFADDLASAARSKVLGAAQSARKSWNGFVFGGPDEVRSTAFFRSTLRCVENSLCACADLVLSSCFQSAALPSALSCSGARRLTATAQLAPTRASTPWLRPQAPTAWRSSFRATSLMSRIRACMRSLTRQTRCARAQRPSCVRRSQLRSSGA